MKVTTLVFGVAGLMALLAGCTTPQSSESLYHDNKEAEAVMTVSQFDTIARNSDGYVGQEIRLAGRIDILESAQEGYEVLGSGFLTPKIRHSSRDHGIRRSILADNSLYALRGNGTGPLSRPMAINSF